MYMIKKYENNVFMYTSRMNGTFNSRFDSTKVLQIYINPYFHSYVHLKSSLTRSNINSFKNDLNYRMILIILMMKIVLNKDYQGHHYNTTTTSVMDLKETETLRY